MLMDTEKQYFRLREAEKETGVPAPTLRLWEKRFEQLAPRKDGHGNRYYTEEDIALIKRIKYIRDDLKITRLEAIQRELQADRKGSSRKHSAADILRKVRSELVELRGMLNVEEPL